MIPDFKKVLQIRGTIPSREVYLAFLSVVEDKMQAFEDG
jgi:hypothetical protein